MIFIVSFEDPACARCSGRCWQRNIYLYRDWDLICYRSCYIYARVWVCVCVWECVCVCVGMYACLWSKFWLNLKLVLSWKKRFGHPLFIRMYQCYYIVLHIMIMCVCILCGYGWSLCVCVCVCECACSLYECVTTSMHAPTDQLCVSMSIN